MGEGLVKRECATAMVQDMLKEDPGAGCAPRDKLMDGACR